MKWIIIVFIVLAVLVFVMLTKKNESFTTDIGQWNAQQRTGHPRRHFILVQLPTHRTIASVLHGESDTVIFLIHGAPLNQWTWEPLIEELAGRAQKGEPIPTIVTYDLRGCGYASDVTVGAQHLDANPANVAWTLKDLANDLYLLYQKLVGTGKIQVGAWGFGGVVAQQFALDHPDLMERLLLFQTRSVATTYFVPQINELANQWINKHAGVDYLTMPYSLVKDQLCQWFYIPDKTMCPATTDEKSDLNTSEYQVCKITMQQANVRTYLQDLKLLTTLNLISQWQQVPSIDYTCYLLSAQEDVVATPNDLLRLFDVIKTKRPDSTFDIVSGKHYYTFQNPTYIAQILCVGCAKQ